MQKVKNSDRLFTHYFRQDAMMEDDDDKRDKLEELKAEHRKIDEEIDRLTSGGAVDLMLVTRLKKHKLALKDSIQKLESSLLPDIIA